MHWFHRTRGGGSAEYIYILTDHLLITCRHAYIYVRTYVEQLMEMVQALLKESDVLLSDELVDEIVDKV